MKNNNFLDESLPSDTQQRVNSMLMTENQILKAQVDKLKDVIVNMVASGQG